MGKSRVRWNDFDDDVINESKQEKQRNKERRQNKKIKNALRTLNVDDVEAFQAYYEDE